jgi:uncharacterized repeat protein (TIGR04138 family)
MQPAQFEHAIESIVKRDPRFDPQAYLFLKEALDFTLKQAAESNAGQTRHVTGRELLGGFRDLALQEFGPMAHTLLAEWGIHTTRHVGEMVFHLIEEQMFGKQDSDTIEDFEDLYDFAEAFQAPFVPRREWAAEGRF